jgi:adenylate/guanylate cyclase family protein
LCGTAIQKNILEHNNEAQPDYKMQIRVAINSGEVNIKDDDVFGEPVNIAARIEAIAEPNEVYFTESIYLSMNKNEIPTAEVGHRKLKGIPEEIKVYKVVSEDKLAKTKADRQKKAKANANLDKYSVNTEDTNEKKSNLLPSKKTKKIGSFWQKHKKKVVIIFIIFLILVIFGIAKDKEKIEQELYNTKYSPQELNEKLPELKIEFDKAIKDENQQKIKALINHLKEITPSLEPEAKKSIKIFLKEQLNNPNLLQRHKQEIKKLIEQ